MSIKDLNKLVNALEINLENQALENQPISTSSVGWHIEHSLLTIGLIIDSLKKSDPDNYKWQFSLSKIIVFTTNKIPRGKAKAPKVVLPKETITIEKLKDNFANTKAKINQLNSLNTNNYFEHPFFGKLNLKATIKFLGIHTKHHLEIVNDIVKG